MLSKDVLGFCFVNIEKLVEFQHEIIEVQAYEGRPKLKGDWSHAVETTIAMLLPRKVPNYSVRFAKNLGDLDDITGQYDGCLGCAQGNESDTSVGHVAFPTQDFERIYPVQIVIQEPLAIIQGYNPTSRIAYADTLKVALPAFTPGLWMLMFFTLMVFLTLFRLKVNLPNWGQEIKKMGETTGNSTYEVLSLFIQQNSFDYHDRTRSYFP